MSEDWGDELDDTPTGFAPVSPSLSPYPPGMSTCVCVAVEVHLMITVVLWAIFIKPNCYFSIMIRRCEQILLVS